MEGRQGGPDPVPELVRMGPGDTEADRRVAQTDGTDGPDDRGASVRDPGPLDPRSDDRVHGRAEQPLLSREAPSPGLLPHRRVHDPYTLLRRRETRSPILLPH